MNIQSVLDELQKIAVTMSQTRAAMGRLKPRFYLGSNAEAFPTLRQIRAKARDELSREGRVKSLLGELPADSPLASILRPRSMQEIVKTRLNILRKEGPPGSVPGTISVGVLERHPPTSALHEQFERAVKPRLSVKRFYTHGNPEVLIKEHNMMSRLRGRGAKQVRQEYRDLRRRPWDPEDVEFGFVPGRTEEEGLRNLFVQQFGPRAAQFLREGQKVPKAMRKRVAENWIKTKYGGMKKLSYSDRMPNQQPTPEMRQAVRSVMKRHIRPYTMAGAGLGGVAGLALSRKMGPVGRVLSTLGGAAAGSAAGGALSAPGALRKARAVAKG